MIDELRSYGFVRLPLSKIDIDRRRVVESAAMEFFSYSPEKKLAAATPDYNVGYRPIGIEYSQTIENPDLNEAYTLWGGRIGPATPESSPFISALKEYQSTVEGLARDILTALEGYFESQVNIEFVPASYIQTNLYNPVGTGREFLQEEHEDGHLFTLLWANQPGLEIRVEGEFAPANTGENEMLVIPGSVMTLMTGGLVAPLYHRVRSARQRNRLSIMYFVNPDIDDEIRPFVETEFNRGVSIRDHVASAPEGFGLPNLKDLNT